MTTLTATAPKVNVPRPSIPKSLIEKDVASLIRTKMSIPPSWEIVPRNVYDNKWRVNCFRIADPDTMVTRLEIVHTEFIEVVGSGLNRNIIREKSLFDCDQPSKQKKNIFS